MTRRDILGYGVMLACAVLAPAGRAAADDADRKEKKDKPSLTGVWKRSGGEMRLEFSGKDVLKLSPHDKDELILVVCKYTVGKDGRVTAQITDLEGTAKDKAKAVLPVGLEFSFAWKTKDDSATLADLKGDQVEALKSHLEGKYEKK
jgi:hypothetical protein